MNRKTSAVMHSQIIAMVVNLNQNLLAWSKPAYKIVQHNYIDSVLKDGHLLFRYARRQLLGMDYYKRACDIVFEIQCDAYFIAALGGWPRKVACNIDIACEEILTHLSKDQNHQVHE